jgi:hypothetical protein
MCLPIFTFVRRTDELDTLNCGELRRRSGVHDRGRTIVECAGLWRQADDQMPAGTREGQTVRGKGKTHANLVRDNRGVGDDVGDACSSN